MSAKDLRLYFLIQTAAAALKKRADARLRESTGLSTAQAAALGVIATRGSVSMRQLADALLQRESAMTTMVRRLEAKGVVERVRSETDKREWQICLTATGQAGLAQSRVAFAEINAALDQAFSAPDQHALAAHLRTLNMVFGAPDLSAEQAPSPDARG